MNATEVTAGLAESNGSLLNLWRDSLHVTCGLTACTPGSALGPMLGNEYGKTLLFLPFLVSRFECMLITQRTCFVIIKIDANVVRIAECPSTFTYVSSVRGCYKVVNRNLNWAAAGLECRSLHRDAHLLVINNAQEQAAVAGYLASASVSA